MKGKATKAYWDSLWASSPMPKQFYPNQKQTLNNYIYHKLHHYLSKIFSSINTSEKRLLEVGCGGSIWLPYFSKQFGFQVWGIDYSEIGCKRAEEILLREKVKGEIVYGDFLYPPDSMTESFDVVISFGVAEHFQDTKKCIAAFSKFLKQGGIMVTVIPNMQGIPGFVQRVINGPLFFMHVQLSKESLGASHAYCGLEVVSCEYFLSLFFSSIGLHGIRRKSTEWYVKKVFLVIMLRFSKLVYTLDDYVVSLHPGRKTGAYIICHSKKPSMKGE